MDKRSTQSIAWALALDGGESAMWQDGRRLQPEEATLRQELAAQISRLTSSVRSERLPGNVDGYCRRDPQGRVEIALELPLAGTDALGRRAVATVYARSDNTVGADHLTNVLFEEADRLGAHGLVLQRLPPELPPVIQQRIRTVGNSGCNHTVRLIPKRWLARRFGHCRDPKSVALSLR